MRLSSLGSQRATQAPERHQRSTHAALSQTCSACQGRKLPPMNLIVLLLVTTFVGSLAALFLFV
jgi:hypothetical protein